MCDVSAICAHAVYAGVGTIGRGGPQGAALTVNGSAHYSMPTYTGPARQPNPTAPHCSWAGHSWPRADLAISFLCSLVICSLFSCHLFFCSLVISSPFSLLCPHFLCRLSFLLRILFPPRMSAD